MQQRPLRHTDLKILSPKIYCVQQMQLAITFTNLLESIPNKDIAVQRY
jgi:hypothetical protein